MIKTRPITYYNLIIPIIGNQIYSVARRVSQNDNLTGHIRFMHILYPLAFIINGLPTNRDFGVNLNDLAE